MNCRTPGFPILHYLPGFTQTHVHQDSDTIQPSYPLLLLPSILPSIRIFSNELLVSGGRSIGALALVLPMSIRGWYFFKIDWFDLLAVQGTLKSLLFQHQNLKASSLWCSAFFMVQLSHPYMTTGKTTALTICTLVSKVIDVSPF